MDTGGQRARRALSDAPVASPVRRSTHGDLEPGAEERVSGHTRDVERGVPERGESEMDGEHRLLPRHDGRSDGRAADRESNAAALARAVDGSAADDRAVR